MSHKQPQINTDQRFIQSQQAIINASIDILLVNPSAGMSDIAVAAGVGRATLYRHFASREVLIEQLILICIAELEAASAPIRHLTGRAAIEATIDVTMPLADRFHFLTALWPVAADSQQVKQVDTQLLSLFTELVDQAKAAGDIDPNLPTVWIAAFYDATLMAAWEMIASAEITIDDAATYVKRSFFSGCGIDRSNV